MMFINKSGMRIPEKYQTWFFLSDNIARLSCLDLDTLETSSQDKRSCHKGYR